MNNKGGRQIARAATLVMALFVVSRVLGLVRQMVVGAMFGTGGDLDAYMSAARIPEMIFLIVAGGALGSAFIPTFADHLANKDLAGAWRLASAVINLALIALTTIATLTAVFAPVLVQTVIAPGFTASQQALTTSLLRLMLISPIIFGVSGIVMAALNAHQHFFLPALAPPILRAIRYLPPATAMYGKPNPCMTGCRWTSLPRSGLSTRGLPPSRAASRASSSACMPS